MISLSFLLSLVGFAPRAKFNDPQDGLVLEGAFHQIQSLSAYSTQLEHQNAALRKERDELLKTVQELQNELYVMRPHPMRGDPANLWREAQEQSRHMNAMAQNMSQLYHQQATHIPNCSPSRMDLLVPTGHGTFVPRDRWWEHL